MKDRNRRSATSTRRNRFRARDLGAATAALTAAAPASATIIQQWNLGYTVGDTFDVTFGGGTGEISLFLTTNMAGEDILGVEAVTGMAGSSTVQLAFFNQGMGGANHFLETFNIGDFVDGTPTYTTEGLLVSEDVAHPGWTVGSTGYAGFTFDPGTGPVFGYLFLRFDSLTDFTIMGWAYQDDGSAIQVSEPALAVMLGLGAAGAALGIGGFRRRRAGESRERRAVPAA